MLCVLVGAAGVARAERKRVVVLEIAGPKGSKFHDELEKLIKKTHTVVPTDKWYGTADELDAAGSSEKNLKKVAKRLKIDAIVEGKVEKRRDEFILRLTLREGRSGELVGDSIDTKAAGARIDGRAQRDLKDELVGAIDNVASNRMSLADDDEDDRPAKKSRKRVAEDDEADDPPAKKPRGKKLAEDDGEDRPARKGKTAKRDDKKARRALADDDEEAPPPKKLAKGKRAVADDDEEAPPPKKLAKKSADDDPPAKKGKRAVADDDEAPRKVARKSDDDPPSKFSRHSEDERGSDRVDSDEPRKSSDGDDGDKPAAKQVAAADDETSVEASAEPVERLDPAAVSPASRAVDLVAGMSVTMRRLSFEVRSGFAQKPQGYRGGLVGGAMADATIYPLALRSRTGVLAGFGLHALFDRPLKVTTKDLTTGKTYDSTEQRFTAGVVFRHPFGHAATSPVLLASFEYTNQVFKMGGAVDNPDVKYSMFEPGLGLRLPIMAKLVFGLDGRAMLVRSTGQIQSVSQYGAAKVLGFEGTAGFDYLITHGIFARAAFRYETIGFTFKGTGDQALSRDGDAMTQDVKSARDNYLGGLVTLGYAY